MSASLTLYALDATLPLLRADSYKARLTGQLWGLWTPSAGQGVLFMGTEEEIDAKLAEYDPQYDRMYREDN